MLLRVGGISLIFLVATAGWFAVGLVATGILSQMLDIPLATLFEL